MHRNVPAKNIRQGIILLDHQLGIRIGNVESRVIVGNGLKIEPHVRDFCGPVGRATQYQTNGGGLSNRDGLKAQIGVVAALPARHGGSRRALCGNGDGGQSRCVIGGWIGGSLSSGP